MLTYTWEYTLSLAVMDIIGIVLNVCFLHTIKRRDSPLNAIDVLQSLKTIFCLIALLVCIWLEIFACSSFICAAVKEILNDIFVYSTCSAFLAIAYIRRKVCLCRGRASILVTHSYAVKTAFVCLMPTGMFIAANTALFARDWTSESPSMSTNSSTPLNADLLQGRNLLAYELCHLLLLVLFPLITSACLYIQIYLIVSQAAKTMDGSMTQRTRDPSKLIITSVTILLSMMTIVWGVFVVAKVVSLAVDIDNIFFLYWKIIILTASPIGDGLLQQSKRSSNEKVEISMASRSARRVHPWLSPSPTTSNLDHGTDNASLAEKLPALIEEAETSFRTSKDEDDVNNQEEQPKPGIMLKKRRVSVKHPRTSVLVRNAAVIGLEYQEKTRIVDFGRQRKISTEKLRDNLKSIEEVALNRERARRLSSCLRFSDVGESTPDEVYQIYEELYGRGQRKSRAGDSENIPQFKAMSYAGDGHDKSRKQSDASSGMSSPSNKLWRKLFTTARSAKRFSEIRKHKTKGTIAEEPGQSNPPDKCLYAVEKQKHAEKPSPKISVFSMAQHAKYTTNAIERRSLDSHLSKFSGKGVKNFEVQKKRSSSCSHSLDTENDQAVGRKKSVTFSPAPKNERSSTSENMSRSFSYDSHLYLNYIQNNGKNGRKQESRFSEGDVHKHTSSEDRFKVHSWLCDGELTREQCMEKLMEMRDYF